VEVNHHFKSGPIISRVRLWHANESSSRFFTQAAMYFIEDMHGVCSGLISFSTFSIALFTIRFVSCWNAKLYKTENECYKREARSGPDLYFCLQFKVLNYEYVICWTRDWETNFREG
jgi:hypothetical protein